MSVMGTGIAAAVAQTAQQAEQVARRRDKRIREARDASQRTREIFETHLKTLEENDDVETTARLQTETDLTRQPHSVPAAEPRSTYDRPHHVPPSAAQSATPVSADAETTEPQPVQSPRQVYQQQAKRPAADSATPHPSLDIEA